MYEDTRSPYTISTDAARLQLDAICTFLAQSYWANTRSRETIARSLQHSLCFGLYHDQEQIGFARVVTDYATFGYLADVFISQDYRGQGLGKWLVATVLSHPNLQSLPNLFLATADAHGLYRQHGFTILSKPNRWMERLNADAS